MLEYIRMCLDKIKMITMPYSTKPLFLNHNPNHFNFIIWFVH
jgi:hypothetical protein